MTNRKWISFEGLAACVSLDVTQAISEALTVIFSNWNYELLSDEPVETFASIAHSGGKYILSSPFMDAPKTFSDPVNILCRLVVELAWAQLRERPELLCLHGAAVEINGRLVVFPSTRRAGKSTLSLGLMAAGLKVFTDDFLPLQVNGQNHIVGVSQGISPRLRLPLPDQIGARARAYCDQQQHVENKQYRYVSPKAGGAAVFGDTAPLGALVFLERRSGAGLKLAPIERSDALTALIKQNFARAMNAPAILNALSAIAQTLPAYRLVFDDVETAVELLRTQFGRWPQGLVHLDQHDFSPAPAPAPVIAATPTNWQTAPLVQKPGVTEAIVDNKRYLSGAGGRNIVFLNEGAVGIWRLLDTPTTMPEIIGLLVAAFPEQEPERIEQDVKTTLQHFINNQLASTFEPNEGDQVGLGDYGVLTPSTKTHPDRHETQG